MGVDLFIVRLLPAAACLWQEAGTAVLESEDERRHWAEDEQTGPTAGRAVPLNR